jgi:hypothetical protein
MVPTIVARHTSGRQIAPSGGGTGHADRPDLHLADRRCHAAGICANKADLVRVERHRQLRSVTESPSL